jgi:hypothetical protein
VAIDGRHFGSQAQAVALRFQEELHAAEIVSGVPASETNLYLASTHLE